MHDDTYRLHIDFCHLIVTESGPVLLSKVHTDTVSRLQCRNLEKVVLALGTVDFGGDLDGLGEDVSGLGGDQCGLGTHCLAEWCVGER